MSRTGWIITMALALAGCWSNAESAADGGIDGSSGDADGDSDGDSDTCTEECCSETIPVAPLPANLLVILDRSRSMSTHFAGPQSFAEIAAEGLLGLAGILDPAGMLDFGLAAFPSPLCEDGAAASPDECTPAEAPDNPVVPVATDSLDEMVTALATLGTCGATPMCGSLEWAAEYLSSGLSAEEAAHPSAALLVTDGVPNCNPDLDPLACECPLETCTSAEQCLDDACAIDAAKALAAGGWPLHVVSIAEDVSPLEDVADDIANAGGTEVAHHAHGAESFAAALGEVARLVATCELFVDWDAATSEADKDCWKANLVGESGMLPYSEGCGVADGWRWQGDPEPLADLPLDACRTAVLCPGTCDALVAGEITSFVSEIGCDTLVAE